MSGRDATGIESANWEELGQGQKQTEWGQTRMKSCHVSLLGPTMTAEKDWSIH